MPISLEVTRDEMEDLIQAVMLLRADLSIDPDMSYRLEELHIKLEERLDLWIHGGEIEVPIPEHLKGMGVASIHKVYEPHDEGVT